MAEPSPDRVAIKTRGRVFFVRVSDIDWVEAAGNYVSIHVGRDQHLLRHTMAEMEERLDPLLFVRIHRCHIVNIDRIRELQPLEGGESLVILRDGRQLTLSRGYRGRVHEKLGI